MSERVKQRRVFYLSGFDPRGVNAYHRLFADESEKQARLMGWNLQVGPRKRKSTLSSEWHAERIDGETTVKTTFEFLHWDDIVRQHWHTGFVPLYVLAIKTYWHILFRTDILQQLFRVAKWPFVTGAAPAVIFFLMPLLALAMGWGTGNAASNVLHWPPWASIAAGLTTCIAVGGLGIWLEQTLSLGWLLRLYAFTYEYGRGNVNDLSDRIQHFSNRIAGYLEISRDDEVLIVGHSFGANLAVSVLATMLKTRSAVQAHLSRTRFLTLGGSIPMQGLMTWAAEFRAELVYMNQHTKIPWVDITAKEDLASFADLNPVHASGISEASAPELRPHGLPANFSEVMLPKTYAKASWDLFRMHFQYLMAQEIPRDNDYFSITTDSRTFTARFGSPTSG